MHNITPKTNTFGCSKCNWHKYRNPFRQHALPTALRPFKVFCLPAGRDQKVPILNGSITCECPFQPLSCYQSYDNQTVKRASNRGRRQNLFCLHNSLTFLNTCHFPSLPSTIGRLCVWLCYWFGLILISTLLPVTFSSSELFKNFTVKIKNVNLNHTNDLHRCC